MFFSYTLFGLPPQGFDADKTFVRSNIFSSFVLGCIRATIALYCFTTLIVCYSWLAHHTSTTNLQDVNIGSYTIYTGAAGIGQSFSFFTYLTFWSLGFYFLFASFHTFVHVFQPRNWWLHIHQWPRPLQLLHSFYYTGVICFPFLVSIVFWGTMYSGPWPEGRFEQWINISVHGLNSLFALVEIFVPSTEPPPWSHLSILLLVLSLYLGLAYLTRYSGGFYVYEWMNPAHGRVSIVLHILGYTGGIIGIFILVRALVWFRGYLQVRKKVIKRGMTRLPDESELSVWSARATKVEISTV